MTLPSELTRLVFSRSGGMLPGLELETTVSVADLDELSRADLERLLEKVDVERFASLSPFVGSGADMYEYDIIIECGSVRQHLLVSQTAMPEPLRPLVRWLERRAAEQR